MLHAQGVGPGAINTFPMPPGWRDVLVKNAIAGNSGETFHSLKRATPAYQMAGDGVSAANHPSIAFRQAAFDQSSDEEK